MSRESLESDNQKVSETTPRPLPWALWVLAFPIIGSMVSRTAMGLVDFVMVSQLGTEAQAAIVPAGIVLFAIIAFGFGLVSAVNTLVAQCHGRGETAASAVYTWQGIWASAGIGLAAVILWPLIPGVIGTAGHAPAVAAMEVSYIQIGLIGVFPVVAAAAVANFFNGIHRPMIGLWATLIANVFNLVANYALIFGHFGFPAMGIAGAAWATTLGALVNLSVLMIWWARPRLNRTYAVLGGWRFDRIRMARLLRIGMPAGVHFAADIAAFTVFTLWIVGQFGTAELAANNIVIKFFEVALIPCVGLGIAVSSAVGKSIGEGDLLKARHYAHWGEALGMVYLLVIAGLFLLLGSMAIDLLADDPAVRQRAGQLLFVVVVFMAFSATQIIYSSALRGAGDTLWPAVVAPIAAAVVLLGGGWAAARYFPEAGVVGPWLALTGYDMVLAIAFVGRFVWGPWEGIELEASD